MTLRDRIGRRVVPRVLVALSTVRWPARAAAWLRRLTGRRARVELFVAFDDAQSAVALLGLVPRLAGRRADLVVRAVVARGIPDDPAAEAKRAYAVVDARRLARRDGVSITRTTPVPADATAFLARWAAAIDGDAQRAAFCASAMRRVWCDGDGPIAEAGFADLWRAHASGDAPANGDAAEAERLMGRRKLYDTPVAVVHGQWFFAHERLTQIEHRLDELGWKATA